VKDANKYAEVGFLTIIQHVLGDSVASAAYSLAKTGLDKYQ